MSEPRITRQAAHVSAGSNLPIYRIVIHATCPNLGYSAASAAGTAAGTAGYFTSASSGGSAQYIEGVDREDHCVADAVIAWHAPPNRHSIGIEITADGGNASAFNPISHAYTRAQWLSPEVWPAVVRAASRTRELCLRLGVPLALLTAADLVAGKHGICGHDDVSAAFGQTNHSDPGPNFPWAEFMALVMGNTIPTPVPPIPSEEIMKPFFIRRKDGAIVIVGPTGVRAVNPAQWQTWRNLGYHLAPGMSAMDEGPFQAVIASLGGLMPAGK